MPKLPPPQHNDDTIGDRLNWAADLVERAEIADERVIGNKSAIFLEDMAQKFEEYGAATFVSQAQLDWLERIERSLDDAEF